MKQWRIGRIHQPWTNLDPPIRSPNFYTNLTLRKEEEKGKRLNKENLDRPKRSRTSVDLSTVGLLHNDTISFGACAASVC